MVKAHNKSRRDLLLMNVTMLKDMIRKHNLDNAIKRYSSMRKADLVDALMKHSTKPNLVIEEEKPVPKKAAPKKAAPKKAAPKKEAAKPAAKEEKAPKEEKSESTSAIAELKDLTGVGPAMVKRMSALGINTVEELVAITNEQATSFNEQDSKISVEQWNKWIAEAKG